MGKKVCHVTSAHGRYDIRIFMKQCKSLAKHGYDATLLVNDDKEDEILDGVKIISTRFKPKNRKERFLNSKKLLLEKALQIDADIYQLHDPDLLPLGNKLKKRGKKVIFDSHEDYPQQIRDKTWIPKIIRSTVAMFYGLYEELSISKYDGVMSVTPHVVERLRNTNPNTVMITNYPIVDKNGVIKRKPEKAICFAGGIGEQWSHENILKAIENIDGIKYILAGTSSESYIEKLRILPSWEKVEYKGRIPFEEVKDIYSRSIAGMALNYSIQAMGQGTLGNTKLFEFMEAELPLICTDYTLWKEIVDEYKCGICVDPNNIEEIKSAVEYIIDNPEEAEQMGKNGRRAVLEKYNWQTQEEILLSLHEIIL